jgi:uncharacterized membrane protein YoaK (UPF0700 family)
MMFGIAMTPTGPDDLVDTDSPVLWVIPIWLVLILGSLIAAVVARPAHREAATKLGWVSVALSVVVLFCFGWLLA